MKDILIACDMCVDFIVHGGDVAPEFNQKEKLVDNYIIELGGSACIFAVQAAKLGLNVTALGKVGNDMFGDLILSKLTLTGVGTEYVTREDMLKTGVSIALCKEDDRAIITHLGSIDALQPTDIPVDLLRNCRHLHISSFYLLTKLRPAFLSLAKQIKENGGTVSLDTNWDPTEQWEGILELLPYVDVFMPNENELLQISGESALDAAIAAVGKLVKMLVVKCGEEGSIGYSQGITYHSAPVKIDYLDGVGAGDSFDAGFIYGLLQGESMESCLQIGNICGAYNTTARGGIAGQINIAELNGQFENSPI